VTAILLTGARVVAADGVLDPGLVRIDKGRIVEVAAGDPAPASHGQTVVHLHRQWLLPGLVDIHVHGGGGNSFASCDPDEAIAAVGFHRRNGTTRMLASLATASLADLSRSLAVLAELTDDGLLAGVHLEGPFLASSRCGAQDPRHLQRPDGDALDGLLRAGRGAVRVVTVAPELPGALQLIRQVVDAGVIAAFGHTDATYEQTMAAIDAGATVATHLFNGMRPIHHREPGPVLAALRRPEVICELIADGVHLHEAVIAHVLRSAGPHRVALITDAILAAGMPDGDYRFGDLDVQVEAGVARLTDGGSLAGSTLTTGAALRRAVNEIGLSVEDAVQAAASTPAALLGIHGRAGVISSGADADLVVCGDNMELAAVMVHGTWVDGVAPRP